MVEELGMVVKIEGRSCIAVTPEGEFREVPLPKGGKIRVGQEISLNVRKKSLPYLRYFMVAASFLVIFLTGQFYMESAPQAAAYLTIDINPSIELAISSEGKVVSGSGLNSDGEKILSEVMVEGIELDQAIGMIVTQAIADNYLTAEDDNVILTTLTVDENSDPLVDLESVYNAIKTSMDSGGVVSEVVIETVKPEVRKEAKESGISTGRFLLQKKAVEKELPVDVNDIGAMSLNKIEKEKKVSIAQLFGGSGSDIREYNYKEFTTDKEKESGYVKQGLYAGRNNASLWIKVRPQDDEDSEKDKNEDKDKDKEKDNNKDSSWNSNWNNYWNNNLSSAKDDDKDNDKDDEKYKGKNSDKDKNKDSSKNNNKDSDKDSDKDNNWNNYNWNNNSWNNSNWNNTNLNNNWNNNNWPSSWPNNWPNNWPNGGNNNKDNSKDNDKGQKNTNSRNSSSQYNWRK